MVIDPNKRSASGFAVTAAAMPMRDGGVDPGALGPSAFCIAHFRHTGAGSQQRKQIQRTASRPPTTSPPK
eukprot:3320056-Prymnesium_polylepis.1